MRPPKLLPTTANTGRTIAAEVGLGFALVVALGVGFAGAAPRAGELTLGTALASQIGSGGLVQLAVVQNAAADEPNRSSMRRTVDRRMRPPGQCHRETGAFECDTSAHGCASPPKNPRWLRHYGWKNSAAEQSIPSVPTYDRALKSVNVSNRDDWNVLPRGRQCLPAAHLYWGCHGANLTTSSALLE